MAEHWDWPSDSQASDELVSEGLGLGDGAKTPGGHLLGVEFDRALWEVEPLLNGAGQLLNPAALLTQDVLGPGGHDDNLRTGRGHTDLNAGVAILGQLLRQQTVKLGLEDTVGHKLKSKAG